MSKRYHLPECQLGLVLFFCRRDWSRTIAFSRPTCHRKSPKWSFVRNGVVFDHFSADLSDMERWSVIEGCGDKLGIWQVSRWLCDEYLVISRNLVYHVYLNRYSVCDFSNRILLKVYLRTHQIAIFIRVNLGKKPGIFGLGCHLPPRDIAFLYVYHTKRKDLIEGWKSSRLTDVFNIR